MGLFTGIKKIKCRTEAAAILKMYFDREVKFGLFPKDEITPLKLANDLVNKTWRTVIEIDGHDKYPHKSALAVSSLVVGLKSINESSNKEMKFIFLGGLGVILKEAREKKDTLKLDQYDLNLLKNAETFFYEQTAWK